MASTQSATVNGTAGVVEVLVVEVEVELVLDVLLVEGVLLVEVVETVDEVLLVVELVDDVVDEGRVV